MIDIVVLAAGNSSRYGGRKLEAIYKGKPLLEWTLGVARKLNGRKIIVISKRLDVSKFSLKGFEIAINNSPQMGLSSSVKLAIEKCHGDGMLLFLGDMPEVELELALKVLAFAKERIVFPVFKGVKGFPVFLPSAYFKEALEIEGDIGLRFLIKRHLQECITFESDLRCVYDVDILSDLKR